MHQSRLTLSLWEGCPQHFSSFPTQSQRGWIVRECSIGQGLLSTFSPFLTLGAKSLLQIQHQERMCTCSVAQSCPALCDPMDCSPPASSVLGILQARILEWVAISFSRGSSQPGIEPVSLASAGGFLTTKPPGSPRPRILGSDAVFPAPSQGRDSTPGKAGRRKPRGAQATPSPEPRVESQIVCLDKKSCIKWESAEALPEGLSLFEIECEKYSLRILLKWEFLLIKSNTLNHRPLNSPLKTGWRDHREEPFWS